MNERTRGVHDVMRYKVGVSIQTFGTDRSENVGGSMWSGEATAGHAAARSTRRCVREAVFNGPSGARWSRPKRRGDLLVGARRDERGKEGRGLPGIDLRGDLQLSSDLLSLSPLSLSLSLSLSLTHSGLEQADRERDQSIR